MDMRDADATHDNAGIDPRNWSWAVSSPPNVSSETTHWRGALLRAWSGTTPVMVQPPLNQHYFVVHLGGTKRVRRRGDGAELTTLVDEGSITLVPAGTANVWQTEGPIAFAHLYIPPDHLASLIDRDFDAEGRDSTLVARVGCRDPLLEPVIDRMLHEIRSGPQASSLLLDVLYENLRHRLVQRHSSHPSGRKMDASAIAPHRLSRVLEFIDANLTKDISLADLAVAAGSSQFHFSRAFQIASGVSPYQYVIRQRIEFAKVLLMTRDADVNEVAVQCGFHSRHQFSRMFWRITGLRPTRFRGAFKAGSRL